MSHCLVTGGAGFIGSHLCEQLIQQGQEVTAVDDLSTGFLQNLDGIIDHPNFTFRTGSITDPVLMAEMVQGVDTIYHLAAAVGVKLVADNPVRTIETNIYPTEVLLRHAVQGGHKFFLASTSEVYGKNPKERWTEEDDLHFGPTTRPRWAYGGPRQVGQYGMVIPRFIDQALDGGPVVVFDDGSQVRCFGHVNEIVDCVIDLTNLDAAKGQVYNIGSDEPVSIRGLAEAIIAKVNPDVKIEYLPYNKAYNEDFEDVQRRVPDLGRLEQTLGQKPQVKLDAILDDIIASKKRIRGLV